MRYHFGSAAALLIVSLTWAMPACAGERVPAKSRNATIMVDGSCDVFSLTYDPNLKLYGSVHTGCALPNQNPIGGIGVVVKKNPGSSAAIAEMGTNSDGSTTGYLYEIDYPFVTGHQWFLYQTLDGVRVSLIATGTYTVAK
jgi:hypothetical protein